MTNRFSKGDYSKVELSNLELEIAIQALSNPKFRLMFRKEQLDDTLSIFVEHQKRVVK